LRGEWARACWQLDRLDGLCKASSGQVAIAKEAAQLDRNHAEGRLSAVVGIEGAHALEGKPERLEQLWERGVRFMSLTHLASNEAAGSSFPGGQRRGLTPYGRLLLERMEQLGMALDIAHASRRTIDEALEAFSGPVFCSHTGMRSATRSWRNLEDAHARELARRGGVVCVIFATVFIGGRSLDCLLRHLERALEIAGEDHVGFGSDFDGMISLPRGMGDVVGLRALLAAMLERGLPESTVRKVMGGSLRRFFAEKVLAGPAR
jgi:membrane dipeptidase